MPSPFGKGRTGGQVVPLRVGRKVDLFPGVEPPKEPAQQNQRKISISRPGDTRHVRAFGATQKLASRNVTEPGIHGSLSTMFISTSPQKVDLRDLEGIEHWRARGVVSPQVQSVERAFSSEATARRHFAFVDRHLADEVCVPTRLHTSCVRWGCRANLQS